MGCRASNTGRGQIVPRTSDPASSPIGPVNIASASEADLIEQVVINRQAYRRGLELLVNYYTRMGNNMKLTWARKELSALIAMPKYKYIIDAQPAGADLKATTLIPEADALYQEARALEKDAGILPFAKSEESLRLALEKYNELISKHPSSDKIDDAAFRAGGIYEYFKDHNIALLYYQRAFQWDPETPHPARFKAAYILDRNMHRRAEALDLYKEAVREDSEFEEWTIFASKRIKELTGEEQGTQ
jgi:tetratricopeptide (TPR) repeat protein